MTEEFESIEGLRIAFVEEVGDLLVVDVYGGADAVCGTVTFTFPDAIERAEHSDTIRSWMAGDGTVTLMSRAAVVTLREEVPSRGRGLAGTPS